MSPQLAPDFVGPVHPNAISTEEFENVWTINRDVAMYAHGEYASNALLRAAEIIEKHAAALPYGYHRHWNRVDAQLLRNMAQRNRT